MWTRRLAWWVSFRFPEKPVSRPPSPELARQWHDRLRRFELSQLTVADFCQLEGYSVASFYKWRRRITDESDGDQANAFVAVDLSPNALDIHHHHDAGPGGDLRIELPGGALLRLDLDANDQQQCRLIKNVLRSLSEIA